MVLLLVHSVWFTKGGWHELLDNQAFTATLTLIGLGMEGFVFGLFTLIMTCDQLFAIMNRTTKIDRLQGKSKASSSSWRAGWQHVEDMFGGPLSYRCGNARLFFSKTERSHYSGRLGVKVQHKQREVQHGDPELNVSYHDLLTPKIIWYLSQAHRPSFNALCLSLVHQAHSTAVYQRQRRIINDHVNVEEFTGTPLYINADRDGNLLFDTAARSNPNFIPTTSARSIELFNVTNANAGTSTSLLGDVIVRQSCLLVLADARCTTTNCTALTHNSVPQIVYSWDTVFQRFLEEGPGASGPWSSTNPAEVASSFRPIRGHGVTSISHIQVDNEDLFLVIQGREDVSNASAEPGKQCAQLWRYDSTAGYEIYHDCLWETYQSQHATAFTIDGHLFALQTNYAQRIFDNGVLVNETFDVPSFLAVYNDATSDSTGKATPLGYFEAGDVYATNGGVPPIQQVFATSGATHAHHFTFNGIDYLAIVNSVSTTCAMPASSWTDMMACYNFNQNVDIYRYNPGIAAAIGSFQLIQQIPLRGPVHAHSFIVDSPGQHTLFLWISCHLDSTWNTQPSYVYKWNGAQFGRHQVIQTSYALSAESFVIDNQTFVTVSNHGCPFSRHPLDIDNCTDYASGTVTAYSYNVLTDNFDSVSEAEFGSFHPRGIVTSGSTVTRLGAPARPVSTRALVLADYGILTGIGDNVTYLSVANHEVIETELIGTCPSTDYSICSSPENMFLVSATSTQGIQSSVTELTASQQDTDLSVAQIQNLLDGGTTLLASLREEAAFGTKFYGASDAVTFSIEGNDYLVVSFHESYMSAAECPSFYQNMGAEYKCGHLSTLEQIPMIFACLTSTFRHMFTDTIVYRIATTGLEEVQRLPSLSVRALEVFDANPGNVSAGNDMSQPVLVVGNAESSCDTNPLSGALHSAHPLSGLAVYQWDASAQLFSLTGRANSTCKVTALHHFFTQCQPDEDVAQGTCGSFIAAGEDCYAYNQRLTAHNYTVARVRFYKLDSDLVPAACQLVDDPRSAANGVSPCQQEADVIRAAATLPGDRQTFDFPDLLPFNASLGGGTFEYSPQLRAATPSAIDIVVPTAEIDLYYRNENDLTIPITDQDDRNETVYYANGRINHELVMVVTFSTRGATPQVFSLPALFSRYSACAQHAQLPVRRQFELNSVLTGVAAGFDVTHFVKQSLYGQDQLFLVLPELFPRSIVGTRGFTSSLHVNRMCDEYTLYDASRLDISGGAFQPPADILSGDGIALPSTDTRWCPYSLNENHFEAYEAWFNHYNPLSGCKNYEKVTDGAFFVYEQDYYNRMPPASLRTRAASSATNRYAYVRASPARISAQQYSLADYAALHASRDNPFVFLQDLPTYNARSAAVHEICGQGGQLWLQFANDGLVQSSTTSVPTAKEIIYQWNSRRAMSADGVCSDEAARAAIQATNGYPHEAALGCFDAVRLPTPVNYAYASRIAITEHANELLWMTINRRSSTNAMSDTATVGSGVSMSVIGTSLTTYGGLQCRATQAQQQTANIDIAELEARFVTLDTDQTVTGSKTFTANSTTLQDAVINGSLQVLEDLAVDNNVYVEGALDTLGLINSIYLPEFVAQTRALLEDHEDLLQQHDQRLCALEAEMALSTDVCYGATLTMGCFVREDLTESQLRQLTTQLSAYLNTSYPSLVFGTPRLMSSSNVARVTVYTNATTPPVVDASSFFVNEYCLSSYTPPSREDYSLISSTLLFQYLNCSRFDPAARSALRTAMAMALSAYGVPSTDVILSNITCGSVQLVTYVYIPSVFQSGAASEMATTGFWTDVYMNLVSLNGATFINVPEALVVNNMLLAPPSDDDDDGSGGSGGP
ncbi:uncharacterized protein MONBRDRAFT_22906 [Monosiga brevicollis MX1]|uniref:Uncharacterized protein n=1 Tax=Monosiga brevicollis TaxID=81824 RepID=A9USF0_MONBE|nr:uncharacterized protein MONBRDRAFT_22906 [Monosiga brevicollis MX1]EDQ91768.1 predicted protein [Monosiga brevicollis MX1]|eukprot:XP_001743054.1 hypothetical protein [Monosiga brevicollis MX1]